MITRAFSLGLVALAASALCCKAGASATTSAQGAEQTVASIDGVTIRTSEVDAKVKGKILDLQQQIYEARRDALDQLVSERLIEIESKARGVSKEEFLRSEIESKINAPTEAEIRALFDQNKARMGAQTLEQVRPRIIEYLKTLSVQNRGSELRAELEKKHDVRVTLTAPRFEVTPPQTAHAKGPANAPITLVEFSDYQCPYCQRAEETVEGLLGKYGDKVRFVLVDYPIEGHPGAFPAARAARCAGDQGKFWEYHQHLLKQPSGYTEKDFKDRAASLGLKSDEFGSCLTSGKHDPAIRAGLQQAAALGVQATPTFFINGRMISGARDADAFEKLIDEELVRPTAQ